MTEGAEERGPDRRHEFAAAVIMDARDRLLLLRRSPECRRWPGKWGLAGGGLEAGETPEEGLRRELLEELGPDIRLRRIAGPDKLVAVGPYLGFIHLDHCLWLGGVIRLSPEHTGYIWTDPVGYATLDVMPGIDEDLAHFGIWPEHGRKGS